MLPPDESNSSGCSGLLEGFGCVDGIATKQESRINQPLKTPYRLKRTLMLQRSSADPRVIGVVESSVQLGTTEARERGPIWTLSDTK